MFTDLKMLSTKMGNIPSVPKIFPKFSAARNTSAATTKDLSVDLSLSELQIQALLIWEAYTRWRDIRYQRAAISSHVPVPLVPP
jgi:hypothetical protein